MHDDDLLLLEEVVTLTRAASVSTVRHWLRTGKLASVRPGRRRLVRRADLEAFLRRGVRQPDPGGRSADRHQSRQPRSFK
jgi:excisionase family DNA binding protein